MLMALPLVHRMAAGAPSWRVATYNAASLVQAGRYDDFAFGRSTSSRSWAHVCGPTFRPVSFTRVTYDVLTGG